MTPSAERYLHTTAYVLNRTLQGESRERLSLLSLDAGLLTALAPLRTAAGKKAGERPSLLDRGAFSLRKIGNRDLYFIQEYSLQSRPENLARLYDAFIAATELARFIEINAAHLPETNPLFDVFENALDALGKGYSPPVTLLKAHFKIARDEGYPVRESWLPSLSAGEQALAINYIGLPLKDLPVNSSIANKLLQSLYMWLLKETDLRVDQRYLASA